MKISTDTRSIEEGDIFLPLVGENFDGHNFIYDALRAGAQQAYSEKELNSLSYDKNKFSPEEIETLNSRIIRVANSLETYHKLANEYRNKIKPITIGITGSSGKTTTKEMLRAVLSEKYKVHYSEANFNNEIGVPKTILSMPEDTEVLILEMGMRGLGQIELLSRTAEPDIAIITNIGTAHIELLGSKENIEKAKLEITACLKKTLVVDSELHERLLKSGKDLNKLAKEIKSFSSQADYKIQGLAGSAIHSDANAVSIVAQDLGLSKAEIQNGLNKYKPGRGRGSFHHDENNHLFIDDSYNANPESVKASIKALLEQFPEENKIAVIGELKESQKELVKEVFSWLKELEKENNFKLINAAGQEIAHLKKELDKELGKQEKAVVLVKASRAAKLERLIDQYLQTPLNPGIS